MIFYSGVQLRENSYTFHSYLKVTNNSLKLSLVYCCSEIHFPDLKISKVEHGYLNSSIFKKATPQNIILTDFIRFGQFQRLKRICESEADVETRDMSIRFKRRL